MLPKQSIAVCSWTSHASHDPCSRCHPQAPALPWALTPPKTSAVAILRRKADGGCRYHTPEAQPAFLLDSAAGGQHRGHQIPSSSLASLPCYPVLVAPAAAAAAAADPRQKAVDPLARSIREILHHLGSNLKTKTTTTSGKACDPYLIAVETSGDYDRVPQRNRASLVGRERSQAQLVPYYHRVVRQGYCRGVALPTAVAAWGKKLEAR